ncbi:hypothetical protein AV545_04070 [Paenibacillus jamilae]|uniref:hypothetical protein n=1 Tax=Paenibacillus TaxID=44249 RepID=UPI00024EF5AB|nr:MULTISPECIES: hypothetical protein [Paenibacillus]EHS58309.1 hypothetical protein WG8_1569 [Paenibacillus sp. Aloe-11]KZE65106.1 hypothetical protein AV545_04070 [Paenibacillus jamilae]
MEKDNRDLEKIISLFETQSVEKANEYISEGWVLLNIHTTDYGHPVERHQNTVFTLGWNGEKGEVKVPKNPFD